MDKIDKIIFINLKSRRDRYDQFINEMKIMNIPENKLERFEAIQVDPGFIGCTESHLQVLKLAQSRGYSNILIFEDDFEFIVNKEKFYKLLDNFFNLEKELDWKVVMLSYHLQECKPFNDFLGITTCATTASGYLVNSRYFTELIRVMDEGLRLLKITHHHWLYMNDQYIKKTMTDNKWFYFLDRVGKQRDSYSDLSGKFLSDLNY